MKKKIKEKKEKVKEIEPNLKKIRIRIVGIGGGGGNIVSELSKRLKDFSSQKVDFVAVNTDSQALNSLPKTLKTFSFGNKLTKGLGTGRNFELGEKAAKEDAEKMKEIFSEDRDLYIFISSLGGGTGTGATPVLTKIAGDMGLSTIGIFTTPFLFEGKKKMDASLKALDLIKENLNAYMVLPNEKIFSLTKEEVSFTDSLSLLNGRLSEALEGLLRTVYNPGLINIDWADIKTIIEGKKNIAYLNFAKVKTNQNIEEIAKSLLKSQILEYPFENALNVMFNVEASKDLSLQMLSQISEKISELSPNAKIIFGLSQNPKFKNDIRITIFATSEEVTEKPKKKVIAKPKPVIKKKVEEEKEVEVRRTALDIKEAEKIKEREEEDEEKIYEIPAFLRKNKK